MSCTTQCLPTHHGIPLLHALSAKQPHTPHLPGLERGHLLPRQLCKQPAQLVGVDAPARCEVAAPAGQQLLCTAGGVGAGWWWALFCSGELG